MANLKQIWKNLAEKAEFADGSGKEVMEATYVLVLPFRGMAISARKKNADSYSIKGDGFFMSTPSDGDGNITGLPFIKFSGQCAKLILRKGKVRLKDMTHTWEEGGEQSECKYNFVLNLNRLQCEDMLVTAAGGPEALSKQLCCKVENLKEVLTKKLADPGILWDYLCRYVPSANMQWHIMTQFTELDIAAGKFSVFGGSIFFQVKLGKGILADKWVSSTEFHYLKGISAPRSIVALDEGKDIKVKVKSLGDIQKASSTTPVHTQVAFSGVNLNESAAGDTVTSSNLKVEEVDDVFEYISTEESELI